jgi:hypothetical protein
MRTNPERYERGSALFVSVMLMVLMGLIGFAALDAVTKDQQVAGFDNRKRTSFYAAEAGVAQAVNILQTTGTPNLVQTLVGDTTIFPHGQPSYRLDPTVADPLEDLGNSGVNGFNLAIGGGGPQFIVRNWRIRVEGQAPGGTTSRLEVAAAVLEGL